MEKNGNGNRVVITQRRLLLFVGAITLLLITIVACPYGNIVSTPMGNWVPIGPEEIIQQVDEYEYSYSGRATVIAVNPKNPEDVWLGTATGGVWHSSNIPFQDYLSQDNQSLEYQWTPKTDNASSLSIGSILLEDCSDERCDTVWVGTGENNIRRDTYYGSGLMKLTWDPNENDYFVSAVGDTESRFRLGSIIDIVRLGETLYIAISKGKSASSSTTIITAPEPQDGYGIHRTNDEGITWEKVSTSPNDALPSDIEIQAGSLLVGFHGEGIYRLSTDDTWCPLGPASTVPASCPSVSNDLPDPSNVTFDHVEIAVSPIDSNVIYAAFGQCVSETFSSCNPLFFVSQDGGTSWLPRSNNQVIDTFSRYTHVLTAHPYFDNFVFYGGKKLWLSTDYGNNFTINLDPAVGQIHFDMQDLVYPDPNRPKILYAASDGGFYLVDQGPPKNVLPMNHGLETVQFYSVCNSDWEGSQLLMGGNQDNGTVLFNGSTIWEFVLGGDGGDCIIAGPELYYASVFDISPHRAAVANPHYDDFDPFDQGIDQSDPRLFFPPFVMHPDSRELYYGTDRLYLRSENDSQWLFVSPHFNTSPDIIPEIERQNAISALALSKSNPNVVYVALYDGDVWVSHRKLGPCSLFSCWKQIGGEGINNGLPNSIPTSLDVDPYDEDVVYIAYSDFSDGSKVWRSDDGGASWQAFAEGLPDNLPVKVIRIKPDQPNLIYLGTDIGVFRRNLFGDFAIGSIRFQNEWRFYGPERGIPNVPVYDIGFDTANDLIYAATHGRGMYMLSDEPIVYVYTSLGNGGGNQLYLFGHGFQESKGNQCSIEYLDSDGKTIAQSSSDARGGEIRANELGRLVSINKEKFGNTTMVSVCMEEDCLNDGKSGISITNSDITQYEITCGKQKVTTHAKMIDPPNLHRPPPSTSFSVRKLTEEVEGRVYLGSAVVGNIDEHDDKTWVVASAIIDTKDTPETILEKLSRSFNRASKAGSSDNRAIVFSERNDEAEEEIEHQLNPIIYLENENLEAMQIFTAFRADPGEANGLAFDLEAIGLYERGELLQVKATFATLPEGAKGGSISLAQRTPVGICKYTLETLPGQSPEEIANGLYSALNNLPYPGNWQCESRHNTYDLQLQGNSVITSSALGLSIEIRDPGVGISVVPVWSSNDF